MNSVPRAKDFLTPDRDEAQRFLELLDKGASTFTFQTYDDRKDRKASNLAGHATGTLSGKWDWLCERNQNGASVCFTVNETDGKGRKADNITRVRYIWQDDDAGHGEPGDHFPKPHIVVQTSPGKFQRYWRVEGFSVDDARVAMDMMVERFGCDPNAKDVARVLRLPGFLHQKNAPFMVRVVSTDQCAKPLQFADLKRWLPAKPSPPKKHDSLHTTLTNEGRRAFQALGYICSDDRKTWLETGMALHAASSGNEEGFELWDCWSRHSHKYDADDQRRTWESFGKTGGAALSLGTLFHIAREHGWRDASAADAFQPIEHPLACAEEAQIDNLRSRMVPLGLSIDELRTMPRRKWLVNGFLQRGTCSLLVAPGGTGKSALSVNIAVALALGDGRKLGVDVCEQTRVLVISAEDDILELNRRLGAMGLQFGIQKENYDGRIVAYRREGKVSRPFRSVEIDGKVLKRTADVSELAAYAREGGFGAIVIDPLVKTHPAPENDNTGMDFVMSTLTDLAIEANAGVLVVHHTKKPPQADAAGFAGDADAGRGASAIKDACRNAKTLFTMTSKEATSLGVPEGDRLSYSRLDDAKANYAPRRAGANWFRMHSIRLPNGDDAPAMAPVEFNSCEADQNRRSTILQRLAEAEDAGKGMAAQTSGRANASHYLAAELCVPKATIINDLKFLESTGDIRKENDVSRKRTLRWRVTEKGREWAK